MTELPSARWERAKERYEKAKLELASAFAELREAKQDLLTELRCTGPTITKREGDVLLLIRQNLTNKEIASHFGITERAVKFHVSNLLSKYGVSSRSFLHEK